MEIHGFTCFVVLRGSYSWGQLPPGGIEPGSWQLLRSPTPALRKPATYRSIFILRNKIILSLQIYICHDNQMKLVYIYVCIYIYDILILYSMYIMDMSSPSTRLLQLDTTSATKRESGMSGAWEIKHHPSIVGSSSSKFDVEWCIVRFAFCSTHEGRSNLAPQQTLKWLFVVSCCSCVAMFLGPDLHTGILHRCFSPSEGGFFLDDLWNSLVTLIRFSPKWDTLYPPSS
jgi:hypothetical protein